MTSISPQGAGWFLILDFHSAFLVLPEIKNCRKFKKVEQKRERQRNRQRDGERETERQRDRETESERERQRDRE